MAPNETYEKVRWAARTGAGKQENLLSWEIPARPRQETFPGDHELKGSPTKRGYFSFVRKKERLPVRLVLVGMAVGEAVIGINNFPDKAVTHHVLIRKLHDTNPFDVIENPDGFLQS